MIRVYRYGLLPPTENAEVIEEQMRLAHRYRNTLVECERGRRSAIRSLQSSVPSVAELETVVEAAQQEVDAADAAIAAERSRTRKRTVSREIKERLIIARSNRAAARRALREARRTTREELAPAFAAIDERNTELGKNARAYSGLARRGPYKGAYGTYQLVEMAMEQSIKTTPFYQDPAFVSERHRKRFRVGVQINNGGMPVAELMGGLGLAQIAPVDESLWHSHEPKTKADRGQGKRAKMRTTLRIRLGTRVDTGEVLYGEWPMMMHREIPAGAIIKRVDVTRERVGRRNQWYACVTADISKCQLPNTCGKGRVAIGFGWRTMANHDLRVAMAIDTDGNGGALHLENLKHDANGEVIYDEDGNPERGWLTYARKTEELASVRDQTFNEVRECFSMWLASRTDLPPWLVQATAHLEKWRSKDRLYNLSTRWRSNRFEGDSDAFLGLEWWRYHEHHLSDWENSQRARSHRQRLAQYRLYAKEMSEKYEELVLADFDLTEVAQRPDRLEKVQNDTANANRYLAAISELEGTLRHAFTRAGGRVINIKPENLTKECAHCGHLNEFDAESQLEVTCSNCQRRWDQDANLCRNLLKRCEQSSDATDPDPPRGGGNGNGSATPYEGKWAKRARVKREKEPAEGGAREPANNSV